MPKLKNVPIDVIAYFSILFFFLLALYLIYGIMFSFLTIADWIFAAGIIFAIAYIWAERGKYYGRE